MIRISEIWLRCLIIFLLAGCGPNAGYVAPTDRFDKGSINISADESFKPVIDSQVLVYEAKYPGVKLNVHYKPEAECLKDLGVDSVRMVIVTRRFTPEEKQFMLDSLKVAPEQLSLAFDAIAVVVHPASKNYLFTMPELKQILKGNFKNNLIPVFDGLNATSTVRYIIDSVLRGDSLTSKALAAKSSEEVINYVSNHPEAVGFIGVSWIGDKDDAEQQRFLTKVKLAEIESVDLPGKYIQPVQANIYSGRYPMIRELLYILKENHRDGLGHGFKNFMTGEKGQLIFRRAYLVPAHMQFNVRAANLREK